MKLFQKTGFLLIVLDATIDNVEVFERFKLITEPQGHYKIEFTNNITLKRVMILYLDVLRKDNHKEIELSVYHPFLSGYLEKLGMQHKRDFTLFAPIKKKSSYIDVVLLAGSAGSFENIIAILEKMPPIHNSYIIVQHIAKDSIKSLNAIIKNRTGHDAYYVENGTVITSGSIYIAPPGYHTVVKSGVLHLDEGSLVNYAKPSIDVTLNSLVSNYHHHLAIVLLCGYSFDGTTGLEAAKKSHSTVIAIEPSVCADADSIPKKAIATGMVDMVLDVDRIVDYLKEHTQVEYEKYLHTRAFLKKLNEVYGYDFESYQVESVIRRIDAAMHKQGFDSHHDFYKEVLENKIAFTHLFFDLSINVTQFLRQPKSYKYAKDVLLKKLDNYRNLKMWCAGVSSGEEAYTLGCMLDEAKMLDKTMIYATDFNPYILEIAKNGLYSSAHVHNVIFDNESETEHFLSMFDEHGTFASVKKRVMNHLHFFTHNLATDTSLGEFQLIVCKNVLIYFDDTLQNRVLKLFYDSLSLDGYLILGESENIISEKGSRLFQPVNANAKIFQRVV